MIPSFGLSQPAYEERIEHLTRKIEEGLDADELAELRELHQWKAESSRKTANG